MGSLVVDRIGWSLYRLGGGCIYLESNPVAYDTAILSLSVGADASVSGVPCKR
jgi:hypothetical protein